MMTKKLYLSIMTLILMIFSSSTATYAWLTMATSNSIKDINLSTGSGEMLEISLDGVNYYDSLPSEELFSKLANLTFTDMTSLDGKSFSFGIKQNDLTPTKNVDYISIELHFRTVSNYMHEVYLANNITNETTFESDDVGTFITSKGRLWVSDVDFLYGIDEMLYKDQAKKFYLHDAMRIAFHDENMTKIFDLTGNEERGYGKPYGAHAYYLYKRGHVDLPEETPDVIYQLSEFDNKNPFALDTNSHLLSLKYLGRHADNGQYYYEGKVTMNIWLEGWDADAFNAIYGDQVKMQFQFKAVRA